MRARHRRWIHASIALLWLGPGAVGAYFWRESLIYIVFMSWFSAVYAAVSAWAAETPVEEEGDV